MANVKEKGMLSIKKILIPLDGSDVSMNSLNYASSFAGKFNVTTYLLTVIDLSQGMYDVYADIHARAQREAEVMNAINENLEETEKRARERGIKYIEKIACMGVPYKKIVEIAKDEEIDLIIMGTHGRSGIAHFLIGSVTEKVIRTAPCPVLVIRPKK